MKTICGLPMNEMNRLVLDYIKRNMTDAEMQNVPLIERTTSAFLAGYKAAQGYDVVEGNAWRGEPR